MKKGRQHKIVGQIGEYLVSAELGRRGYIATTFTGNVPEFDILVTNEKLITTPVQVKTIRRGGSFQTTADKWMNISIEKGVQKILGKTKPANPDLIYVMVILGGKYGEDEFYLLKEKELQELYFLGHSNVLRKFNGRRPRNPESLHGAVGPNELEKYKDNWKIFEEQKSVI